MRLNTAGRTRLKTLEDVIRRTGFSANRLQRQPVAMRTAVVWSSDPITATSTFSAAPRRAFPRRVRSIR
jgi:hypothetical protein